MLGDRLKELRKLKMYSLEELSRRVDKSVSTLSRYESDNIAKPDLKLVSKLAEELETSFAYLLGMTDDFHYTFDVDIEEYASENNRYSILVTDDDMSPETPLATDASENGLGFIPNDMSELRISYNPDYVTTLGKAVSMKVFFED